MDAMLAVGFRVGVLMDRYEEASEDLIRGLRSPLLQRVTRERCAAEIWRQTSRQCEELLLLQPSSRAVDRPEWPGPARFAQAAFRKVDRVVGRAGAWIREHRVLAVADRWTFIGLALTVIAALFVLAGLWVPAFVVVLVRLSGSVVAGGPAVISVRRGQERGESRSLSRLLVACLSGHLADQILIAATAFALADAGRVTWALGAMGGGMIALFGSLARVAAERSGVRITRSGLERCARNGGLVLGLVLAAAAGPAAVTTWTVPAVALVAMAAGAYGVFEVVRIVMLLLHEPHPRWSMTLTVDEADQVNVVGPPDAMQASTWSRTAASVA
jgi:hypothetical protein